MSTSKPLHTVKARHAYVTTVADQLSFAAGDLMSIVAKNGGWWMGVKLSNPAERGWVPSNYLSIVGENGELEKVQVTPRTQAGQVRPETMAGSTAAINLPVTSPSPSSANGSGKIFAFPPTSKPLLYAVKANHKFAATQPDGLSFEKDEVMSIIDKKDGWLRGVNKDGKEGWVPSNYVKQIEGSEAKSSESPAAGAVAASSPSSASNGNAVASNGALSQSEDKKDEDDQDGGSVAPKRVLSVSTYEVSGLNSSAPPAESPTTAAQVPQSPRPDVPPLDQTMTPRVDLPTPRAPELPTDSYVATPRTSSSSGTDTPEEEYRDQVGDLLITPRMAQSIGQSTEKVRGLYNFDAKKPDHLSFKKGDILIVIKKKQGWWKVHHEGLSGKLGYIPSNYVKPLVEVAPNLNPTQTVLTAAGVIQTIPAEFEPTKERPLLVKASHSYKPVANNQLAFNKGDFLHVFQKNKAWWKAYRVEDSEKVGYIPSNYVKVVGAGDVPTTGEGSLGASAATPTATNGSSSTTATTAAASTPAVVEMEEIAVALHDLDKKDPKILAFKRDDRFSILDRNVGGGWWRCQNLQSGEIALAPSNFMRLESVPKRQPPPLPAPRGSVPNQTTMFVEGTYDFTAKKPSQLSYKKYDSLVILKKEGSWWKARNKMGKEGVIPFNYVKEVFPTTFITLFPYTARKSDEVSIKSGEEVSVLDMEQPGWWLIQLSSTTGQKGYAPSTYLHPLSTRTPGVASSPATPRSALEPEVPATPRNPDGTTRQDPVVAEGKGSVAVPSTEPASAVIRGDGGQEIEIVTGTTAAQGPGPVRKYSGSVSVSPVVSSKDEATLVEKPSTKLASVVLPEVKPPVAETPRPEVTPRPAYLTEQSANGPRLRAAPLQVHEGGRSSAPPPALQSPTPVDQESQPSISPLQSASATQASQSKLSGFFDRILPSSGGGAEVAAAPVGEVTPQKSKSSSSSDSFSGFSPSPNQNSGSATPQVEGRPSSSLNHSSNSRSSTSTVSSNGIPPHQVYGYYEGEGDSRPEGTDQYAAHKKPREEESKEENPFVNQSSQQGQQRPIEIGSTSDPRSKSELNNRGACASGWQSFLGIFATCTGSNRATDGSSSSVPKPQPGETNSQEEKTNH